MRVYLPAILFVAACSTGDALSSRDQSIIGGQSANPTDFPTVVVYSRIAMHALSRIARFILDRMEGDCRYDVSDLRAFVPDASPERLLETMHELWIGRHVERAGYSGWRRHRSAPDHEAPVERQGTAENVKPEDLFDHDTFEDFFRS